MPSSSSTALPRKPRNDSRAAVSGRQGLYRFPIDRGMSTNAVTVERLRSIGYELTTLAEMATQPDRYDGAIPVLLEAFDREFERLVSIAVTHGFGDGRRMVVFGLSKSTRPAAVSALLSVFEQPEVTKLATDALIKLGAETARPALLELLNDPRDWVSRSAARALRTIG